MSALGKFLRMAEDNTLIFKCPGCDIYHQVMFGAGPGPRWSWNGDAQKPTFEPSILVQWAQWDPPATTLEIREKIDRGEIQQQSIKHVCHSFVRNGQIEFLNDCTHAMAGKAVNLPEINP